MTVVVLELALLALIMRSAWTWPRGAQAVTNPDREAQRV